MDSEKFSIHLNLQLNFLALEHFVVLDVHPFLLMENRALLTIALVY